MPIAKCYKNCVIVYLGELIILEQYETSYGPFCNMKLLYEAIVHVIITF